jgi:hypothetical protein
MQVSSGRTQRQSSVRPPSTTVARTSSIRQHVQPALGVLPYTERLDTDTQNSGNYPWQTVKKRKRSHPSPNSTTLGHQSSFKSPNPTGKLLHLLEADRQALLLSLPQPQPRIHKPPPIYVHGVTNYCTFEQRSLMMSLRPSIISGISEYYLNSRPCSMVRIILKSYLHTRFFQVKYNGSYSTCHEVLSDVAQGSVLGPLLYLILTDDLPTTDHTIITTFADHTRLLATHSEPLVASLHL